MSDMQFEKLDHCSHEVEEVCSLDCIDTEDFNESEEIEEGDEVGRGEGVVNCREVESDYTPYVGMKFSNIEEAVIFYKAYALLCGFDVRKYTSRKWRDGSLKSQLLVCNREGFPSSGNVRAVEVVGHGLEKEVTNKGKIGEKRKRNFKETRVGCKANIMLVAKNGSLCIDKFHSGHNHQLVSVKDREFQKLSRNLSQHHKELIISNSRVNIGATKTYNMCKEQANGFENIGASLTDFKNFHRDVKCLIHDRDGQLFVDHFRSMAETRNGFYFDFDVDEEGCLSRAIWVDGVAKANYSIFGDAVSYDPTYQTNRYAMVFTPFTGVDNHKRSVTFCAALIAKEDYETFNWVFSRFLIAMGGKEPEYIITDQDPAIIKSVNVNFKTARHRFCMWHIMNKVPMKYGSSKHDYPDFIKKLNAIVWDDELEPSDFDTRWAEIMQDYGVGKDDWFADTHAIRKQWVMAHCRDLKMGGVMRTTQRSESANSFFKKFEDKNGTLVEFWMRFESAMDHQRHTHKKLDNDSRHSSPKTISQLAIEGHAATLYTHAIFDEFQEEIKYSMRSCVVKGFSELSEVEVTKVKDTVRDKTVDVQYNPGTNEACCTCRMFERKGILCRHIIWIYSGHGVKQIPMAYISRRWTKDVERSAYANGYTGLEEDVNIIDGTMIEMSKLWSEFHKTVVVLRGKRKADVEELCTIIREFRENIEPSAEVMTKQQELERLLGCTANEEVTILAPKHSKNKGSGKRMLSHKEKIITISNRHRRLCGFCKEMAHHDSRNCPKRKPQQKPVEEE